MYKIDIAELSSAITIAGGYLLRAGNVYAIKSNKSSKSARPVIQKYILRLSERFAPIPYKLVLYLLTLDLRLCADIIKITRKPLREIPAHCY